MIREALSNFPDSGLKMVGLLLFLVVFVGIVVWTFRKSGRKYYERMANLPFDEGDSR